MNIKEEIEKCRKQITDLIRQASEERIQHGRSRLFRRLCKSIDELEGELDDLESLKALSQNPIGFSSDPSPGIESECCKNGNVAVFDERSCDA
ncbi:MAG: hypothetical protein E7585_07720 [Ruminococcaceae bacterium]|nr:hypothetical protein [Oscillospiraceae bacterium]